MTQITPEQALEALNSMPSPILNDYMKVVWLENKRQVIEAALRQAGDVVKNTEGDVIEGSLENTVAEIRENMRLGKKWGHDVVPYCKYEELEQLCQAALSQRVGVTVSVTELDTAFMRDVKYTNKFLWLSENFPHGIIIKGA